MIINVFLISDDLNLNGMQCEIQEKVFNVAYN